MQHQEEVEDRSASQRLRCVQQITDADDETLTIVSAVLNRAQSNRQPVRRTRRRSAAPDAEAGAK